MSISIIFTLAMQFLEELAGLDWEVDEPRIQSSATSAMLSEKKYGSSNRVPGALLQRAHKLSLKEREMLKIMKSM